MGGIGISTESVSDLPLDVRKRVNIEMIYLDVVTDSGVFVDTLEISDRNVIEYMAGGHKKAQSREPSSVAYQQYFEQLLEQYDEVIHISISKKIARCVEYVECAIANMGELGKRIHCVDSMHLSSGLGMLVYEAANLRNQGVLRDEIIRHIEQRRSFVSTSFITKNADYLYYNGRASERIMRICQRFALHPVLQIKNGNLSVQSILVGDYDKACIRYVNRILKKKDQIQTDLVFLTYAGCSVDRLNQVEEAVKDLITVERLVKNQASAAISCNCGPDSFGILYANKA